MVREAIHPGEFLADELTEIGMTRTELAGKLTCHQPYLTDYSWQTGFNSRYCFAVRTVLWHRP